MVGWKEEKINCEVSNQENNFLNIEAYKDQLDKLKKKELIIENLCFGGGGMKCIGYVGAVGVLEELGILTKIKKYVGTSGGAIFALLCALNYSEDEMYKLALQDQGKYLDRECSCICGLLNLFKKNYGYYKGDVIEKEIKVIIDKKFKVKDATFEDLYRDYGKELIVIVCNMNKVRIEYCSVKFTPKMPLYLAIKMSISMPGVYESVNYNGERYIDGGLTMNYPLEVFSYENKYFMEGEKDLLNKTIGFSILSSKTEIIREKARTEVESKGLEIETVRDYVSTLLEILNIQNVENEINLINRIKKDSFFKSTVLTYISCLKSTEFQASKKQKEDVMKIFRYKTIEFLSKR